MNLKVLEAKGNNLYIKGLTEIGIQGEHNAQAIKIIVPLSEDGNDYSALSFGIKGVIYDMELRQGLAKQIGSKITLSWLVHQGWTGIAGKMRLTLIALDEAGNIVKKWEALEAVDVRKDFGGLNVPPPDVTQQMLDQILQKAAEVEEIAATPGADGADGRGIASVIRTSGTGAPGTTDTYTITFTDSTTTTFQVHNGANGADGATGGPGENGADGADGRGIASVIRTSGTGAPGTTDTYTITFTDSTTTTFQVVNGADGSPFDIIAIVDTEEDLPDPTTVSINGLYLVGTESPYGLYAKIYEGETLVWVNVGVFGSIPGEPGADGADGRGIASVIRTSGTGAPGTTDTYTITFTDSTTTTFQVHNGANGADGATGGPGENGADGADGRGIASVIRTSGTGAPGTTDTYTITFTDSTTTTFQVHNGANGAQGIQGTPGQSAYAAAQSGGYTDTQAAFYTDLAALDGLGDALAAIGG
jgi:hypothetical protein